MKLPLIQNSNPTNMGYFTIFLTIVNPLVVPSCLYHDSPYLPFGMQKTNMTHRNSGFTQLQNGGSFHCYVATFSISGKPPFSYGFPIKTCIFTTFLLESHGPPGVKPYETLIFVGSTSPIL